MFQLDSKRGLPRNRHRGRSKTRGFDRHCAGVRGNREPAVRAGCSQKIAGTIDDLRICDRLSSVIDHHTRDRVGSDSGSLLFRSRCLSETSRSAEKEKQRKEEKRIPTEQRRK